MKRKKVSELAKQIRGVSYKPEDLHENLDENSVTLLRANNIFEGRINFDDVVYVDKSKVTREQYLCKGDILVCASSGSKQLVGKAASFNFETECTFGAFCKVVRPNQDVANYLSVYFQSNAYRRKISEVAIGANINNIRNEHIDALELPIGSNAENEKVVASFSLLQQIIDGRKQQLQKLDELVKARFVEFFGDMVYNQNGWKMVNLGSVCDVRDGTHDSPKYFSEGYPLVTSKNVTSGRIDFAGCSLICKEDYDKINERSRVDFGDILMPMIGTVGKPVIVDVDVDFAIKNVALIKFYENSKVINIFVRALLQSDYFDCVVISKIRGGTQKFISLSDIRKLGICLPPMDTQNEFASFVEQTDKSKVAVQKALDEAQLLFDSLMQKYFG